MTQETPISGISSITSPVCRVCGRRRVLRVPADNAAASPHERDGSVVQGPSELIGGLPEEHEALGVGDDL